MFESNRDISKVAKETFEVASRSTNSFLTSRKDLFSEEKRKDVFTFTYAEWSKYLTDAILVKSPDTVGDARFESVEERTSKYHRFLAAALLALSYASTILEKTPPERMRQDIVAIVQDRSFWNKFSVDDTTARRSVLHILKTLALSNKGNLTVVYLSVFTP